MKKILTVSLVAMMAVSAARADIASTLYVQGAVGAEKSLREAADSAIETKIGTVATGKNVVTMISDAQAAAEAKVTALQNGQVKTNTDAIASINEELDTMASDETVQGIRSAIDSLNDTYATDEEVGAIQTTLQNNINAKVATETYNAKVGELETAIAGKQGTLSTAQLNAVNSGVTSATVSQVAANKTKSEANEAAIADIESSAYATSGITSDKVSTYDGYASQISAKEASANKVSSTAEAERVGTDTAFPTVSLVNSLISTANNTLGASVQDNALDISGLKTGKQAVSTADYQMGNKDGSWTAMTTAQQGALNSGITSAKVSTYETAATNASAAKGVTDLISAGTTGSDGTYVLTATVSNNTVTGYKWELIDRAYSN